MIDLRPWQQECLTEVIRKKARSVIVAPPGSGKTLVAAETARYWINEFNIDHVVILVAQKDVQIRVQDEWTNILGIPTYMKVATGDPRRFGHEATVLTYHSLNDNTCNALLWWTDKIRLGIIADEFHHLRDIRQWGEQFKLLKGASKASLMMSGTPFRTDGVPITGVDYDEKGYIAHDYSYELRRAVQDRVCRRVSCQSFDAVTPIAWKNGNNTIEYKSLIQVPENLLAAAGQAILIGGDYLDGFIRRVCKFITELRARVGYEDAAVLWVCPVGVGGDEEEKRYIHIISEAIKRISGEEVTTVSSDDETANDQIRAFRNDKSKIHLCAIRMVSEGVDIPRLRVLALCSWTGSQLLLRQLVGRVARVTSTDLTERDPQPSIVFHPAFRHLTEFFKVIEDEAYVSADKIAKPLAPKQTKEAWGERPDNWPEDQPWPPTSPSTIFPLYSGEADYSDGVTRGVQVEAKFIKEALFYQDQDTTLKVMDCRDIARILQVRAETPNPADASGLGLAASASDRRKQLSEAITRRVGRLAILHAKYDPTGRGYSFHIATIYSQEIHKRYGVSDLQEFIQTRNLDVLERATAHLDQLLKDFKPESPNAT